MNSASTIYGRFLELADNLADRPAVLFGAAPPTTFGELADCVARARVALHTHRIGRGSRIGFLVPNRPTAGAAHLVACATGTSVPLNPSMTPNELLDAVREFRIDGILIGEGLSHELSKSVEKSGVKAIGLRATGKAGLLEVLPGSAEIPAPDELPLPEDVAVLLQTSGTTSTPKLVPQTNFNRFSTLTRFRGELTITPNDRCLNLMPLHHTQGLSAEFLAPLLNGASVVFATFDPANIIDLVKRYRPTWFNLVPSMHQAFVDTLGDAKNVFEDSSLRYVRSSSARLTPILRERLELAFGVPVVESYGASETSNIASTSLNSAENREGSVGRPSHSEVVITDENGIRLPTGERGEICVSGPTVISSYENNPEANAERFRDGLYRTGDEGYLDEDGFLYITGRLQEVVNRGGEKFSLTEVDDILMRIDGVVSAAAFMAEHGRLGHEIYAAAVVSESSATTPANIRAELAEHLSWAKMPKKVFVVSEIPVNSTGKVLRNELAKDLMPSK